jgi:AcrR family transcriptional regulator
MTADIQERPAPRWRRRKEARPGEILASALEIFGDRGYEATRLSDVARKAGCTKGTIFLYYENKAELFKAALRDAMLPLVAETERLVEMHHGTTRDLLGKLLRLRWEHMMRNRFSGLIKLMLAETRDYPELAKFYNDEFIERNQALLRRVLQQGVDQGEFKPMEVSHVARFVVAPMVFAVLWRHAFEHAVESPVPLEGYFDTSLQLILDGLATGRVPEHAEV